MGYIVMSLSLSALALGLLGYLLPAAVMGLTALQLWWFHRPSRSR